MSSEEIKPVTRSKQRNYVAEYNKSYYLTHRDKALEKGKTSVVCECGRTLKRWHMARHRQTAAHKRYEATTQSRTDHPVDGLASEGDGVPKSPSERHEDGPACVLCPSTAPGPSPPRRPRAYSVADPQ